MTRSGDALPFELAGDDRGVLLVHGFTGSPFEMHYLGQALAERGVTVSCPALAGHATRDGRDLDATTWHDWYATVTTAFDALRKRCRRVAVVGLSLGGLLTLHLARERDSHRNSQTGGQIAALGVLAAPLWLPGYARVAIPAVRRLVERVPRFALVPKPGGGSDVRDDEMRRRNPSLPVFPVRALQSLLDFTAVVRAEVDGVRTPTFIAHGARDHTAPPACSRELATRIGARDTRYLVLPRSFHVITIDVERAQLAREVGDFVTERL